MRSWVRSRLGRSEKGATAVEYGLMVAFIAAVIVVAVLSLGNNTNQSFQCASNSIAAKASQC